MNGEDVICRVHLPAAVDDFLTTPLHLRVVALHRGEVERYIAHSAGYAGGRAAAQADQHGRSAQYDEFGAHGDRVFLHMRRADITDTARQPNGLMVTASLKAIRAGKIGLEAAEVTAQGDR